MLEVYNTPDLPVELYRLIFHQTAPRDLAALARVSHAFQQEAEDVLYLYIDIGFNVTGNSFVSWCLTVANVPRKAHRINTLRLFSNFRAPMMEPDLRKTIAEALAAMINLKHLYLVGRSRTDPPSVTLSSLKACPFRLLSFGGDTADATANDMWEFLDQQSDIQHWIPTKAFLDSISSIPSHILPRLRKAGFINPCQQTSWLRGRPIEVFDLTFFRRTHTRLDGVQGIASLIHFTKTLHTLCYRHGPLHDWSATDVIRCIAEYAPNLVTLVLENLGVMDPSITVEDQRTLNEAIAMFGALETLVLHTTIQSQRRRNGDVVESSSEPLDLRERNDIWQQHSLNPVQCRRIATSFMIACPSLRRLSIPFESENGSRCTLTYVRSSAGETAAEFDGFYTLELSGWRR